MIFEYGLTIPADTTADSPAELEIKIPAGTIINLEVQAFEVAAGQVYTRMISGVHQLYPSDERFWFRMIAEKISTEEEREIRSDMYNCKIQGVNRDPTYEHSVEWRLTLIPFAQRPSRYDRSLETKALLDYLGGL